MPSFFLNKREQAHKQLGHWHFDPEISTGSHIDLTRQLSPELCNELIELGKKSWDKRTSFNSYLYLTPHQDSEIKKDKQEIAERFQDKPTDTHKEWFNIVYLDLEHHVAEQIKKQLDIVAVKKTSPHALKANQSPFRLAVQRPGCITINHIDHIYHHSPDRPGRYDDPWERKIVVFLEDHVFGQYFNIGNHNFHPWHTGQSFTWDWGVPHHACNFSTQLRHNLMITVDARQNPRLGYKLWR